MGASDNRRDYDGDGIRVHWESAKCIHTARCLQALPQVFDVQRRPWVDVRAADAPAIADAVERCPTGALRYSRTDGAPQEQPHRPTVVVPIPNGPLLVAGALDVCNADGNRVAQETRLTLCRCGMSRNAPYCDNSHLKRFWQSGDPAPPADPLPPAEPGTAEAPTRVKPHSDASLELRGDLQILHHDGTVLAEGRRALLCRCGHSRNKPFCDGSHEQVGFRSVAPEIERERLEAETPAAFEPNRDVPDPEQLDDAR